MPGENDVLPVNFKKNVSRFCIHSSQYFYHSCFRADVLQASYKSGQNMTTSRGNEIQSQYESRPGFMDLQTSLLYHILYS